MDATLSLTLTGQSRGNFQLYGLKDIEEKSNRESVIDKKKKKKKDCGRTIQRGLSFYIGLLSFLNWCKGISRGGGVFACLQRWKGITRQRQNQIRSQKCIKKKIKGQSLWRCATFWNIRQLHQIMPITIGDFRVSKCISILQVVQVSLPLDV